MFIMYYYNKLHYNKLHFCCCCYYYYVLFLLLLYIYILYNPIPPYIHFLHFWAPKWRYRPGAWQRRCPRAGTCAAARAPRRAETKEEPVGPVAWHLRSLWRMGICPFPAQKDQTWGVVYGNFIGQMMMMMMDDWWLMIDDWWLMMINHCMNEHIWCYPISR